MAENNTESPVTEGTQEDSKDIVEIEWSDIEPVFTLREELQELEQYLSQAFVNFEKTKAAVMNRIVSAEGRMYNTAEELKVTKGVPPDTAYELKMPNTIGEKAYFIKRGQD